MTALGLGLFDVEPYTEATEADPVAKVIELPFYRGPYPGAYGGFMATVDQRMTVLRRLATEHGIDLDAQLPPQYSLDRPLQCWCWLVLTVNGIDVEFTPWGEPYSLAHYGIDLGFSESAVREWFSWLA